MQVMPKIILSRAAKYHPFADRDMMHIKNSGNQYPHVKDATELSIE